MEFIAQPHSLTVPLTDVIEAVDLIHPDSPADRVSQQTRYTSLAIINFTLMIFVGIVLLALSACSNSSDAEPGNDGNNAANDPVNPVVDDTEDGNNASESPDETQNPETDPSQSGSDDIATYNLWRQLLEGFSKYTDRHYLTKRQGDRYVKGKIPVPEPPVTVIDITPGW